VGGIAGNDMQRAELALRLKPLLAAKAKENQVAAQNNNAGRAVKQNSAEQAEHITTRDELAKAAGVSHDTISKVKKIAHANDGKARGSFHDMLSNAVSKDVRF